VSANRISVVIPTRNRAHLLTGAIESVLGSPLIRGGQDIIVVDDGSTDDTYAVEARYGVRYVRVDNAGPSGSRNTGLARAEGEFVAFLDDDDRWLPGNMAPQLEALLRDPGPAFAYGRSQRTSFDLVPFGTPMPEPPFPSQRLTAFLLKNDLQLGAVLFRRQMVAAIGGFDNSLPYSEDTDLVMRLAEHGAVGIDLVVALFRQREPNALDAEKRWLAHQARNAAMRKWDALHLLPAWPRVVEADLHYRGMTSYWFCRDARRSLAMARRREGLRWLFFALRVSTLHSLFGHRGFWGAIWSLLFPPSGAAEAQPSIKGTS
jgi:glycosyltransferase involved in cell wall biosynthesis